MKNVNLYHHALSSKHQTCLLDKPSPLLDGSRARFGSKFRCNHPND